MIFKCSLANHFIDCSHNNSGFNPLHVNAPLLYPLKTSETLWFSDILGRYRNGILACNGLKTIMIINPAKIYLFKINNRSTRKRCEICSKLTIETLGRRHWRCSNIFHTFFWCFYCWLGTSKCWLGALNDLLQLKRPDIVTLPSNIILLCSRKLFILIALNSCLYWFLRCFDIFVYTLTDLSIC